MLQGIPKVIAGLGMARNTIKRALRGLEEKGFLVVHHRKAANGRDLAPKIEIVCKMSHLKISKKHRAKELGEGSTVDHPEKEENSSSSDTSIFRPTRAAHAVAEEVKTTSRRRRRKKARDKLTTKDDEVFGSTAVQYAWKNLMLEYYPQLREPAMSKSTAKRVTGQLRHHLRSLDNPYEFMEWCIVKWDLLKRKEFKTWGLVKMTPDINVWGMAMSQFVGFYATRDYYDRVKAEDLPATSVSELERQLADERAQLYETRGQLALYERIIEKYRREKNG